jgi:hypothetical protein
MAARPYFTPLAISKAVKNGSVLLLKMEPSCSVLNLVMPTTGPKISSCWTRQVEAKSVIMVGFKKNPLSSSFPNLGRSPPVKIFPAYIKIEEPNLHLSLLNR